MKGDLQLEGAMAALVALTFGVVLMCETAGVAAPPSPQQLISEVARKSHPRLLFTKWEETPGHRRRAEPPYGGHLGWLFYAKVDADRHGGLYAAFYYQVSKDKTYAQKAKEALAKVEPFKGTNIRLAAGPLINSALAYDWVHDTLSPEEDRRTLQRLAALADSVYRKYPTQGNTHDRIIGASALGVMALALAGYDPKTPSKPVDWLRDATVSLFIQDRFQFPSAYRHDRRYGRFCPALLGVCNRGGFCRIGGYRAYWVATLSQWLLIYAKATGRNPLDDFPIARGVVNDPIWESMPNRMDSQQGTRASNYWGYYHNLLALMTPPERGAFRWYATAPKVDPLRRRRTTASLDGVPWGLCCYEKDLPTAEPFWTSFYSPECEAMVFRGGWELDSDWLFFKCMNQPITSHRDMVHHDNLSFELYSRGDYLLSDGGEIRNRMVGYGPEYACGHNTLLIDGTGPVKEDITKEYFHFVSPARFTDHCLENWLEFCEAEMDVCAVEIDPVKVVVGPSGARGSTEATKRDANAKRLAAPVNWRRAILYPGRDYFLVVDRARSKARHHYEFLFHLSSLNIVKTKSKDEPGHVIGALAIGGKNLEWAKGVRSDPLTGENPRRVLGHYPGAADALWKVTNLQRKAVELRLASCPAADALTVGRIWGRVAETRPPFSGRGGEVDHPFVAFRHSAPRVARLTALLARYPEEEPWRATPIAVTGEGSAMRIQRGDLMDLVGVGEGRREFGGLETDAEVALVREKGAEVQTALLMRGRYLSRKGSPLVAAPRAIRHATFHFSGRQIAGHLALDQPTAVEVACRFSPTRVSYRPAPPDWVWVWTKQQKEKYKPRPLAFHRRGDNLVIECPRGTGGISIK